MYAVILHLDESVTGDKFADLDWSMREKGFRRVSEGVFTSDSNTSSVLVITRMQRVGAELPWLRNAIDRATMWRIDEVCDLSPALSLKLAQSSDYSARALSLSLISE